ncbi:MAG: hypothetical protein ACRDPA_18645 [Solirubrobacteraceae bacterium]
MPRFTDDTGATAAVRRTRGADVVTCTMRGATTVGARLDVVREVLEREGCDVVSACGAGSGDGVLAEPAVGAL